MFSKLFAVVSVLALSASWSATAMAAPAPSVAVSLVCDRGVGSSFVVATFQPNVFDQTPLGSVTLSCGPDSVSGLRADRQKVSLPAAAGWVNISTFTLQTAAGSGGCPAASEIPAKVNCQIVGTGPSATLTVR